MLATVSLWVATAYLMKDGIGKWRSLLTAVPATFMNAVVVTYLLGEPNIALGRFIPMWVAYIVGGVVALGISGFYVLKTAFGIKNMKPDALPLEDK